MYTNFGTDASQTFQTAGFSKTALQQTCDTTCPIVCYFLLQTTSI